MGDTVAASNSPSARIQWMWNVSADPFSTAQPAQWQLYSDVENLIIEEAFQAGETYAMLDGYHIDVKKKLQISNNNENKQRPVKRIECNKDDKPVRAERYLPNPIAPDRPYGGQYGFISPFIKEVVKDLKLTREKLLLKDQSIVPMIVEKAADGIIEEGKKCGKQREAEKMAQLLIEKKEAGMKEVWKCCAYLYSWTSFLYSKLNEVMRLIGSEEHEQVWRSKVRTLGPFCLLLWDNPFSNKLAKWGTILYRGAQLSNELIVSFKSNSFKDNKTWHSFQAFTSCTRNRSVAEMYGNTLFIMKIHVAFTIDLSKLSKYPDEDEELLLPGVSFMIDQMDFDKDKNMYLFYLTLRQRHNRKIFQKLCSYIGFYTENILISFDEKRLHGMNKKYIRKQRNLINRAKAIKDTTEGETPYVSGADDVSETSDQQNEKKNNDDDNNDDDNDDDDNYDDISSTDDTSYDGTSDNNTDNDDDNDDKSGRFEDSYYNPKSGKWADSDEDN